MGKLKFNFFFLCELPLISRVVRKREKWQEISERGLQIPNLNKIGQLVLGARLGKGQRIINYFSSVRDFSGKSR